MKRYTLIGKIVQGIEIQGFIVNDNKKNKRQQINKNDLIKLVKSDNVSNATVLSSKDNNVEVLKIDNGIDSLEDVKSKDQKEMKIVSILVDSKGKCIGFKAEDESGKSYNLSVRKCWELAVMGTVHQLEARVVGGKKTLTGKDNFNLNDISKIEC